LIEDPEERLPEIEEIDEDEDFDDLAEIMAAVSGDDSEEADLE
jgi:hypothetical protein